MKRERGILAGLGLYAVLGSAVIIGIMGLGWKLTANALANCRNEHAQFVAEVKAKGELAEAEKARKEKEYQKAKETADERTKRLVADLNRVRGQLRHANGAISRLVPRVAEATGTAHPERACYKRDELSGALQRFTQGVAGLVDEGDDYRVDSSVAKGWIRDVYR